MHSWVKDLFGTNKPVIAMAHIPALPGTPRYDAAGGIAKIIKDVRCDVDRLTSNGVDALMFCNEDDRPYVFEAGMEQIATMSRVVSETAPDSTPFGVDFLWDPMAAIAIAHATGASFIREVLSGSYESDMGHWSPSPGRVLRFRHQIGAANVRVFYNVAPEFSSPLGSRDVVERAYSAVISCLADAILISGPMAGVEPEQTFFERVKSEIGEVPLFMNTGARIDNLPRYLPLVDGIIVGSSLKVDGVTWNEVDAKRVHDFMDKVRSLR
jgi:membrane complex biogenesis BtpA family protein